MKTSTSRYTCILLNSILVKRVLAVTALLLTSQIVIAGGSHPHRWLIDTTVILNNATTIADSEGNLVTTDCFAEGEVRLRSRWVARCPPHRPSVGSWSDCPPSPWSPWWALDDEGSVRIANAVSYPPPSNEYQRDYHFQYRPVNGQYHEMSRSWHLNDIRATNAETEDETWTMVGAPSNYLAGYDGVLRIPNTWRINLNWIPIENCGDPLPIESDDEGGGTSTFPITAAKDGKTDKKMYTVMKEKSAKPAKKKMQAEHAERYRGKRKQLVAEVARHVNKRLPSQKGRHKRLCTHIQLAEGEKSIAVCGAKARKANPKLWEARLKLWKLDQRHPPEEEPFEGGDKPAGPDGDPEQKCYCGIVNLFDLKTEILFCEISLMRCSQCDPVCE